ncbi:endonuclease [Kitasatospora sp. NPDC092948]|uniref:endonuclease n=1 Tax=Kitasatospora sp. NPDC092948 TaxID=3364088 RepID=UPI00381A9761
MTALDDLLDRCGTTYAEQAGIRLRDTPAPLYQLLVLTQLCAVRIRADTAAAAARELFAAKWRTPRAMAESGRQQRIDALDRAQYVRYDESTATALVEGAELVRQRWRGDLRRLRAEAGRDPDAIGRLLREVPRIGLVGADVFRREAQLLWPELRPFFDHRALDAAARLGLPRTPDALAELVPARDLARLSAALVRSSRTG